MFVNRRGLLIGLGSLIAAPAIVRAASLMPVKAIEPLYGIGPMMRALPEYRAEWARQWEETARYIIGQTVLSPGRLLICVA